MEIEKKKPKRKKTKPKQQKTKQNANNADKDETAHNEQSAVFANSAIVVFGVY